MLFTCLGNVSKLWVQEYKMNYLIVLGHHQGKKKILDSHLKVKVAQLCLTLCYPVGYTAHGILQARILEWVVFPLTRGSS